MRIEVYFNNGCVISCNKVVNSKRFWRKVSKWCKYHDRNNKRNIHTVNMRVVKVVKEV